jgi:SpoVK/Ycf46/Vps4 family AAA+-type ATPase
MRKYIAIKKAEGIMNLAPFELALRKNYARHSGPFNWIAAGFDMAIYNLLGRQEKKAALLSIYMEHFDTIENLYQNTTAIERILWKPTEHQDFFQLILCSELVRLKKVGANLSTHSVGDYTTTLKTEELAGLVTQFRFFKSALGLSSDRWVEDCIRLWGSGILESWLGRQIDFLVFKQKSLEDKQRAESKKSQDAKASDNTKDNTKDPKQFEIIGLEDVTLAEAEEQIDRLVGLGGAKTRIIDMITFGVYDKVRLAALGKKTVPCFNNFILSGPPGVGKTTLALCLSRFMAANGIIPKKQVIFTGSSGLIGMYCGETEKNIEALFQQGRGGVIVIDEADSFAKAPEIIGKHDAVAINTLNALIGYEKDTASGTVIILTGYKDGMELLLNTNQGMSRRFPHRISIPSYDRNLLKQVFVSMASARGYEFDRTVAEVAGGQIARAKECLGKQFGNAGTVEELIHVMETGRANWIGHDILQKLAQKEGPNLAERQVLSQLKDYDIPLFDPQSKTFRTMAAIKESKGNLVKSDTVN